MPPEEAAAVLLVRQDVVGTLADEILFTDWLAADPANSIAWARACSTWESFANPEEPEFEQLRASAGEERPRQRRWFVALAASVALVAASSGLVLVSSPSSVAPPRPTSTTASSGDDLPRQLLTTAIGERRTFALADHSSVTLNTDSAVAVAFRSGERRLELIHGQAFFAVAHHRQRPFVVESRGRSVIALGTRFEVRAHDETMRVVLVEGLVKVVPKPTEHPNPVILRKGQQLVADGRSLKVMDANITSTGDWQRGVITFHNTTLAEAATELNRYAAMDKLVVRDPRIAALRVSGVFRTNESSLFARTVEQIYPVRIIINGETREIVDAAAKTGTKPPTP
jgi:transmembrane sensor